MASPLILEEKVNERPVAKVMSRRVKPGRQSRRFALSVEKQAISLI